MKEVTTYLTSLQNADEEPKFEEARVIRFEPFNKMTWAAVLDPDDYYGAKGNALYDKTRVIEIRYKEDNYQQRLKVHPDGPFTDEAWLIARPPKVTEKHAPVAGRVIFLLLRKDSQDYSAAEELGVVLSAVGHDYTCVYEGWLAKARPPKEKPPIIIIVLPSDLDAASLQKTLCRIKEEAKDTPFASSKYCFLCRNEILEQGNMEYREQDGLQTILINGKVPSNHFVETINNLVAS